MGSQSLEISTDQVRTDIGGQTLEYELVDVREHFELASGILPGARIVPTSQFLQHMQEFEKEREYVIYCAHGIRSLDVAAYLQQHGYRARSMSGGFAEWTGPVDAWNPER